MNRKLTTVPSGRPFFSRLVKWTVLVILILVLAMLVIYIIGSYQKIPDESQLALIRFCLPVSVLLIISSFYGFVFDLYYAIRIKNLYGLIGVLGYAAIMVFGAFMALGAAFIIGAVGGNR